VRFAPMDYTHLARNTPYATQEKIMLDRAQSLQNPILNWRRAIHQYPEIGFAETRTAALVTD